MRQRPATIVDGTSRTPALYTFAIPRMLSADDEQEEERIAESCPAPVADRTHQRSIGSRVPIRSLQSG
jgi:hypothetical protein